jgi:hypothetical protein
MPASAFAQRLASVAIGEHNSFPDVPETDPRLRNRIYDTYLADLKAADPNDPIGWNMPADITKWAWSAAFVSWCALEAGATLAEFDFSVRHAVFVKRAIANADGSHGVFRARRITSRAPAIGDFIGANQEGGSKTYDEARNSDNYPSHTAIVVELIQRLGKKYAVTIGGNERDAIRRTEVELTPAGLVKQRQVAPYICVIENLKQDVPVAAGPMRAMAAAPLAKSFQGHGTFVYEASATLDDYGSVENTATAMTRAGMTHAWVRVHGRKAFTAAEKRATQALIDGLKAAGIAVAGWGWCQGEDPRAEAGTAIRELGAYGLADYVADIENGHSNSVWTVAEVELFCKTLRKKLAGSLAISSFALIDWHAPYLMTAAARYVDAFAPQVYWFDFPNTTMVGQFKRSDGTAYAKADPGAYADLCLDRWRLVSGQTTKPLVLTGQAYWGESGLAQREAEDKLRAFLKYWDGYGGIAGLNWWHFGGPNGMSHAMLEAITDAKLGSRF